MPTQESDLQLYYSGALEANGYQDSSLKSLGGYKSSVLVPNNRFDSIFDELGYYEAQNGQDVFRCVFLKNESAVSHILNLELFVTGNDVAFELIRFGVSIPANNLSSVQLLQSPFDYPNNVTFYEAYRTEDAVIITSDLSPGAIIALWLNRVLSPSSNRKVNDVIALHFSWV